MTFGAESTTDQVLDGVDLTGQRVVVTGASSGLGEESTRALCAKGASVTMLARSPEKNEEAAARIRETVPDADLSFGTLDLSNFESIRQCAKALRASHDRIDVLLNNAGVMACPEGRTSDGFEMQFGTNHLGHFLLTALVAAPLLAAESPRAITLSSAGHSMSDVNLDDINFSAGDYDPWIAYGRAKTANALFARGLAQRFGPDGLRSYSVHPGAIVTNLGRHLNDELIAEMMDRAKARKNDAGESVPMKFKSVEAGAATQVWAAANSELSADPSANGAYLADCSVGVEGASINGNGFMSYLLDQANTDRLWTMSEDLTGQVFA